MKWLYYLLGTFLLLLAVALALPLFVSLDHYIPRIEKELSARLNEPVTIESIRFKVLSWPHVTIDGIKVGTTDDIKLDSIRLTPDLFSLLQTTKVIKSIEIDAPTLNWKAIGMISALAEPDTAKSPQPPPVRVDSIRLNDALIVFGTTNFGPFDAQAGLDSNGDPLEASLSTQDGKLKAFVKPGQSNYLIDLSAKAWTVPLGPAIAFDELSITGVATRDDAALNQISAKLYGGTVVGKATLSWRQDLRLAGNFDLDQVETQKLANLLSTATHVSGKLSGKATLSGSAPSADHLANALRLEMTFQVQNGVIHGVDILKAATLTKQEASSGETRFDRLSGHLVLEHGEYRFSQLEIASGALAVDGNVTISPNKELSGRLDAQVKVLGAGTTVPLNVAGTLGAPLLYPTAATMAGAAVGTAILGPGLGTSVGAKLGGWTEGLFRGAERKKQKE